VNAVVGSFTDAQLLEDLTASADVVFDIVSEYPFFNISSVLTQADFRWMPMRLKQQKSCWAASRGSLRKRGSLPSSFILYVLPCIVLT
jgi:hypothetical protein